MFGYPVILLAGVVAGQIQDSASPAVLSRQILDDALPADKRRELAVASADRAAEVVAAMVADLPRGDEREEYRRIPWIWRVAIAAGKSDRDAPLRALLDASLPQEDEKLRDWQAVVIGGGIINAISLSGKWPQPRIESLIGKDESLRRRWQQSLAAAAAMADDAKIKTGTRYDALRMIALDPTNAHISQLGKHLAKDSDEELQMGAVSGLSDVDSEAATGLLASALPDLAKSNQALAIDALLRTEERTNVLLGLLQSGKFKAATLSEAQQKKLRELPNASQRERAIRLLDRDR